MRSIVNDELKHTRAPPDCRLSGVAVCVTDDDYDPAVCVLKLCDSRVDVAANDPTRVGEVLGPDVEGAAVLDPDLQ